jgi:hypothetical protein
MSKKKYIFFLGASLGTFFCANLGTSCIPYILPSYWPTHYTVDNPILIRYSLTEHCVYDCGWVTLRPSDSNFNRDNPIDVVLLTDHPDLLMHVQPPMMPTAINTVTTVTTNHR